MHFSKYNNKSKLYTGVAVVIFVLLATISTPCIAQQFSSRQQHEDFERFEQLRSLNRDSAHHYAERLVNDIDTLATSIEVAMVYDFMAEYAETTLHRYGQALEYRLHSARIYEILNNEPCIIRTNALLGRIYLRNGDYHNAFSHSTKALDDAKRTGDKTSERES